MWSFLCVSVLRSGTSTHFVETILMTRILWMMWQTLSPEIPRGSARTLAEIHWSLRIMMRTASVLFSVVPEVGLSGRGSSATVKWPVQNLDTQIFTVELGRHPAFQFPSSCHRLPPLFCLAKTGTSRPSVLQFYQNPLKDLSLCVKSTKQTKRRKVYCIPSWFLCISLNSCPTMPVKVTALSFRNTLKTRKFSAPSCLLFEWIWSASKSKQRKIYDDEALWSSSQFTIFFQLFSNLVYGLRFIY